MNFNIQHTIEQNAIKGNYLNSIAVTQKENTKKINKNKIFNILKKNNYNLKFKTFVNYIFVKNEFQI